MELITNLFEYRFDDLVINIYPVTNNHPELGGGRIMPICNRYSPQDNNIHVGDGNDELIISLITKYDDQDLYESLCMLKNKIENVKISKKPVPKQEKMNIKEEYKELRDIIECKNEKTQDEYRSLVSQLELLEVNCAMLVPPLPQVLPKECWNWREYETYQNCGITISCGKSTELFAFVMNKFRNHRPARHIFTDINDLAY
jgi:hypothetical protein